eukprot:2347108-Amphidinium_carterae.1
MRTGSALLHKLVHILHLGTSQTLRRASIALANECVTAAGNEAKRNQPLQEGLGAFIPRTAWSTGTSVMTWRQRATGVQR